ncbi:MAG: hypothetical protein R2728_03215 [Chitinophagales bacterium]
MKTFFLFIMIVVTQIGHAQSTESTQTLLPITNEIRATLAQSIAVECTLMHSSKTFAIDGKNAAVFINVVDAMPPSNLSKSLDGIVMFVDNDNNSIDANFYYGENGESYLEFKVDDHKYYNKLTPTGVEFFGRFK